MNGKNIRGQNGFACGKAFLQPYQRTLRAKDKYVPSSDVEIDVVAATPFLDPTSTIAPSAPPTYTTHLPIYLIS